MQRKNFWIWFVLLRLVGNLLGAIMATIGFWLLLGQIHEAGVGIMVAIPLSFGIADVISRFRNPPVRPLPNDRLVVAEAIHFIGLPLFFGLGLAYTGLVDLTTSFVAALTLAVPLSADGITRIIQRLTAEPSAQLKAWHIMVALDVVLALSAGASYILVSYLQLPRPLALFLIVIPWIALLLFCRSKVDKGNFREFYKWYGSYRYGLRGLIGYLMWVSLILIEPRLTYVAGIAAWLILMALSIRHKKRIDLKLQEMEKAYGNSAVC